MAAAILLIGGCSEQQPKPTFTGDSVAGVSLRAELDRDAGAVILPADRLSLDALEQMTLAEGVSYVIAACAAKKGVVFVPPEPTDAPVYLSESYFGPWTPSQASTFGFVMPMTEPDLVANGIIAASDSIPSRGPSPNESLTDADWEVMNECSASDPDVAVLTDALRLEGPWVNRIAEADRSLPGDARTKEVLSELYACYEEHGMRPSTGAQPWLPAGANASQITEDQIALALRVVECKDQVDFTQRVADIHAQLQAPVIAEYAEEMVAQRTGIDEALSLARGLMGGEG